ncbi:glycine hydroxymethyltransferase [uncultured archaeon]|nr:glycine hydroxymethyltransferase [uncultured archaeon]
MDIVRNHNSYRAATLNLQVSENVLSQKAREALSSDMASRYSLVIDSDDAYGGTRYSTELLAQVERLACDVYGARYAEVRTIGGHIAASAVLLGLIRKRESIMAVAEKNGGYTGYAQGYLPHMYGFQSYYIPFNGGRQEIDLASFEKVMDEISPKLIVLGQSFFVKPYDLKQIRRIADRFDSLIAYDGSHVMGLIAGKQFQPDVLEYCDVLYGSTHKTFFGPQGGIVLTNDRHIMDSVRKSLIWKTMDNYHISRVAALGVALEEMKKYGKEYAANVVSNTKKLARSMDESGIPVDHAPWYSESHQSLLNSEKLKEMGLSFLEFSKKLEANGMIVDREGRIGSAEVTRMGIRDIERVGPLMAEAMKGGDVKDEVRKIVSELSIQYCE